MPRFPVSAPILSPSSDINSTHILSAFISSFNHGQKTHKGSFPSIFRNTSVWGNKKLRAAVDHSLSGRWQPTASISDFCFLFSVFWHPFSVFCLLISVFCLLISDICFLSSGVCSLMSVFWCLFSVFWFLFSDVCFLFSYHILHWVKKTAHLINKICCPYCQAFSELRIDLSAFSFSGFRQPLSVFIRQINHSALRTWWDACR